MKKVKVTIGLCVKNVEQTVKETICSILNQDFPHERMELIVVDGCSKDKTLSIIREMIMKTDIKFQIFCENNGLGFARQVVANNAKGDYIIWVDGDMVLPRNFLSTQVKFMEQHSKVGIGKARYCIGEENYKSLPAFLEDVDFVIGYIGSRKAKPKVLGTSGSIYRVEAIKQAGGFDENMRAGEDADIEYRVKANGWSICITPAVFSERRRTTWRLLWDEYFWLGYGTYYLYKKQKEFTRDYRKIIFPLITIAVILQRTSLAYRLLHQKTVLLLPLHWIFKRLAWIRGFLKAAFF
ncbi:MAG: glycosyltransferase [Nitrososphaeria archaeon]